MKKMTEPRWVHPRYREGRWTKKMGFDLHGVVDTNFRIFRLMMRALIRDGWEVHIITGGTWEVEGKTLRKLGIPFTHFFSIVDHHVKVGTKIRWDKKGRAHLDPYLWDRTKAIYCREHRISMHFDDSDIYERFFKTPYIRYFSNDSKNRRKLHLA